MSLPDYQEIEQCLCGDPAAAAESHGTLCGLLCTASDDLPESWIHNTLAEGVDEGAEFDPAAVATLGDLYEETRTSLAGDAMAFRPFLPAEDVDIGLRAEAVGRWCQGFLYGMAVRGLKEMTDLPDDVREILEDFSEISRAIHESGDEDEQAEFALVELVEYVRVGVQLIFDLLNPPTKTAITETR